MVHRKPYPSLCQCVYFQWLAKRRRAACRWTYLTELCLLPIGNSIRNPHSAARMVISLSWGSGRYPSITTHRPNVGLPRPGFPPSFPAARKAYANDRALHSHVLGRELHPKLIDGQLGEDSLDQLDERFL